MAGDDTIDETHAREGQVDPTLWAGEVEAEPDAVALALAPAVGASLGRYVVLERIGTGGMGVVYAAWDPQLDRKLALKLLDPQPGRSDPQAQARLLREAQAMARLEHPNVVTIHDVGIVDDRVFIAMEYVDGQTLRAWLGAGERRPEAIVAVFEAAGRGLAAAHAAGLVHRDFKPDNVMVGGDGRVRVLDFGLARRRDDVEPEPSESGRGPASGPADTREDSLGSLTRTGVIVGTPAYMSPEQFRSAPLDARSDQFSFCVALWEALTGERPFAGESQAALARAVDEGELRPFANPAIPARFIAALERGLAPTPDARWPDMPSLLAALELHEPSRRRPDLVALGLVGALGLAAAAVALLDEDEPASAPAIVCEVEDQRLAGIWDEPRAAALEAAFAAVDAPWAATSGTQIRAHLDAWTADWRASVEDTCAAHHLRHELSAELFDLRMACLDQRLRGLDSFVELVSASTPAPELAEQALAVALELDGPASCMDPERLRDEAIDDPELAARVAELEAALDRREQMQDLGMYEQAIAEGERLRPELEAVGRPAQWSRYHWLRAIDELALDRVEAALDSAVAGVAAGQRTGRTEDLMLAIIVLARATLRADKLDESARWLTLAEAMAEEPLDDPWCVYELHKGWGFLALREGRPRVALASFERSLALARTSFGPRSIQVMWELSSYGVAASKIGAEAPEFVAPALDAHRQALALARELLAPDHPTAISTHGMYIEALLDHGRPEEAVRELDALEARLDAAAYPPEHSIRKWLAKSRARVRAGPDAEATAE